MSYEVIGETIKSAISVKLGQIFGNSIARYKEQITNIQYPNFFIYQVSMSARPERYNRYELNYLINIRYRQAEDASLVTNLQQILNDIGFRLCTELLDIQLELPIKTSDRRFEVVDGVLQFFCNVRVITKLSETDIIKMRNLKINEEV